MVDVRQLAQRFRHAEETGSPVDPVTADINRSIDIAYDIQEANVAAWLADGRRQTGWKIGLTSGAARQQMQATEPMLGALFADMEITQNDMVATGGLIDPRIEPEIAVVLKQDIVTPKPTLVDLLKSIDFAIPAFEIVDCRSRDWKISAVDAVADNALASGFVLGTRPWMMNDCDFAELEVCVEMNGSHADTGIGANCLGHPLFALQWLSEKLLERGRQLSRGDLILTGSLCPMIKITTGDAVTARFGQTRELIARID